MVGAAGGTVREAMMAEQTVTRVILDRVCRHCGRPLAPAELGEFAHAPYSIGGREPGPWPECVGCDGPKHRAEVALRRFYCHYEGGSDA